MKAGQVEEPKLDVYGSELDSFVTYGPRIEGLVKETVSRLREKGFDVPADRIMVEVLGNEDFEESKRRLGRELSGDDSVYRLESAADNLFGVQNLAYVAPVFSKDSGKPFYRVVVRSNLVEHYNKGNKEVAMSTLAHEIGGHVSLFEYGTNREEILSRRREVKKDLSAIRKGLVELDGIREEVEERLYPLKDRNENLRKLFKDIGVDRTEIDDSVDRQRRYVDESNKIRLINVIPSTCKTVSYMDPAIKLDFLFLQLYGLNTSSPDNSDFVREKNGRLKEIVKEIRGRYESMKELDSDLGKQDGRFEEGVSNFIAHEVLGVSGRKRDEGPDERSSHVGQYLGRLIEDGRKAVMSNYVDGEEEVREILSGVSLRDARGLILSSTNMSELRRAAEEYRNPPKEQRPVTDPLYDVPKNGSDAPKNGSSGKKPRFWGKLRERIAR